MSSAATTVPKRSTSSIRPTHYNGTFDEEDFSRLLDTLATVEGKFMLTMFPHEKIERLAARHGWTIHRLDRTITASKVSRRRQEEWITTNY